MGISEVFFYTSRSKHHLLQIRRGNHLGTLITSNAQYYAYGIAAKSGYVIRILQRETKNRALLKGFVGQVVDLAFAHSGSNKLAVLDQAGNLYYYNLDNANGDVQLIAKQVCVRIPFTINQYLMQMFVVHCVARVISTKCGASSGVVSLYPLIR